MPIKPQFTEGRYRLRTQFWDKVQFLCRKVIQPHNGMQSAMARALGCTPSQIHRFTCPVCEHNQEPTFSMGMGVLFYALHTLTAPPTLTLYPDRLTGVLTTTPPKSKSGYIRPDPNRPGPRRKSPTKAKP